MNAMKRFALPIAAAIALTALSIVTAFAQMSVKTGDIEITAAWTRATLPGQPAGAGYMIIENKGAKADRLLSAASDAAQMTQVHTMEMTGDVMKMSELNDGLEIPAGGKVELKPGGTHIMFMGLKQGFKEGGTVKVTLKFEQAGEAVIELPVQPADTKEMLHTQGG
jgi:periplasmic copper chaperone A